MSHVLDCAGPVSWIRKGTIAQSLMGDTIALVDGEGRALAVAFLVRQRRRRVAFALAIRREAAPYMRQLVKFAHLTLEAIAQTGVLIVATIHPANRQGQRMARLAGFRPGRYGTGDQWVWRAT